MIANLASHSILNRTAAYHTHHRHTNFKSQKTLFIQSKINCERLLSREAHATLFSRKMPMRSIVLLKRQDEEGERESESMLSYTHAAAVKCTLHTTFIRERISRWDRQSRTRPKHHTQCFNVPPKYDYT